MKELAFSTIQEIKTYLTSKQVSVSEVADYFFKRIATHDSKIQSLLEVYDKESIGIQDQATGTLAGIPGINKANICMQDRITSCASKILANYKATYDATAIKRLKKEGALIIGSANMDEFAMGSSTETSAFQKTKNPWDTLRVPGGSSGGSAAAVAAGLAPWALGSETGGSVRQPAALCGIVGIKPTYGLISRYGLVAYASSLDQIGVFSRSVYDNALVLSAMTGHDTYDSSSLAREPQDFTKDLTGKLPHGLKIGIVENAMNAEGIDPEISVALTSAVKTLEALGATVSRVSLPILDYSAASYFILSRAEAASNLARFDGVRYGVRDKKASTLAQMYVNTRHDGFGQEVRARIMVGNYVLSASYAADYYENAKKVKAQIRQAYLDIYKSVDLLVMPTHPIPAFKIGAYDMDKLQIDLQDYFTCSVNLAGIPAISIPCGMTGSGLPIGFQIIGPHLSESLIYQAAHAYEQVTEWHTLHPRNFE
jgi:aspartyl-tRNA(Asn)/glutamyl-tRNA(Gln) amidotransferase subunit A